MKSTKLSSLSLLAAIAVASASAFYDAPTASASELATAKTVEVQELFSKIDDTGVLKPLYKMTVDLAPGAGVKVLIHPVNPKVKGAYYIANPKKEFEFYGEDNNYREIQPDDNGHASSQIRFLGCVDLLQNDGKDTAPDATRTITHVVLDGRKMILQSDARTQVNKGVTTVYTDDLWTDEATGLPYRRTGYGTTGDKTVTNLSIDFSDWKFNKKLSADYFDFNPPAGAKPLFTPVPIAAGTTAPDFTAIDSTGQPVKLSSYKGKIVILDFWATWCNPCQESMPHLDSVYKAVKNQDVVVLALCVLDSKIRYNKWVTDHAQVYSFPTAFDPAADGPGNNIPKTLYQVTAYPTTYVIDKDGKINAYLSGYTGQGDHRLEAVLNKLGIDTPETTPTPTPTAN